MPPGKATRARRARKTSIRRGRKNSGSSTQSSSVIAYTVINSTNRDPKILGPPTKAVNYDHFGILSGKNGNVDASQAALAAEHDRLQVTTYNEVPGTIDGLAHFVPWESDKLKGGHFMKKLGLKGYDVFEYTFVYETEEAKKKRLAAKEPAPDPRQIRWDYNNGMTQTKSFFKAASFTKQVPKKAIEKTEALLNNMTVHLNGGRPDAQGFWMPYTCARALAATMCYKFAAALTPIFGPTFPQECLHPNDPRYQSFEIAKNIIAAAQQHMTQWRARVAAAGGAHIPFTTAMLQVAQPAPARGRPALVTSKAHAKALPSIPSRQEIIAAARRCSIMLADDEEASEDESVVRSPAPETRCKRKLDDAFAHEETVTSSSKSRRRRHTFESYKEPHFTKEQAAQCLMVLKAHDPVRYAHITDPMVAARPKK